MPEAKLSTFANITLRTIIILQIAHTALLMTADILYRLVDPYPLAHFVGGRLVSFVPPWPQRLHWDNLSIWCVALVMEIFLFRAFSRLKRYTWAFLATQLIASLFYLLWVVRMGFDSPPVRVSQVCLLLGAPFAIAALWGSRKAFSIHPMQIIQIALAIVLAAAVVFVNGRYFPGGSIEWAFEVPMYIDVIASSRFGGPQESSLVLSWCSYALVTSLFWVVSKTRSEQGSIHRF